MRQEENETYEQWLIRALTYEKHRALIDIAIGRDPNQVLEDFANRLTAKAMHPIIRQLRDTSVDKK